MANEIRNNEHLSFSRWAMKAFHENLPGFDGFRESGQDSGIVQAVIENDLTKYLNKVTEPLADETSVAFEKAAKGRPYDPVGAQLILSVGAIHTTSDLTCQTMTHLAQNPEIVEPLRKEIVDTLQQHGWKKVALYNMKLLDSVIRESQRLKPVTNVSMRRMALKEVKLSDGTVIPKNGMLAVSAHKLWDDDTYENAASWDGYRFYKMRDDPERQTQAQLVTTAPENLAFGHGKHACPGRFFAANEVKIVLIYLLLRYDWKLLEGTVPRIFSGGFGMSLDPTLKIKVRRRREEMEI
ncbi:hypothetical protein AtubIFM56815_010614 [Aspergillus tubingensis]|uniref:Uncharacterized protein n=1 Tax=Aspergillus tubingensis TaxID=5068 RepID=A0A9W6ENI3_ASPTU|nr:hypothetical protein AtubIFM56815_010614 [Aspergillus tubingensis]